jgi:hypothetical protein
MPYEVSVPAGSDYVRIRWYGVAVSVDVQSSGIEALRLVAEENKFKVLIDVSELQNRLSTIDLYANTAEHSRLAGPRPRTALVGRPDQEQDLQFVSNVGSNRGMPIRAFTNLADALDWLSK